MLLFRSEEHVDSWCRREGLPRGGTMSLEQGWRLADAWYRRRMEPDWQRYSPEEAQAIFTEIGLTGAFWQLRA